MKTIFRFTWAQFILDCIPYVERGLILGMLAGISMGLVYINWDLIAIYHRIGYPEPQGCVNSENSTTMGKIKNMIKEI